MFKHRLHFFFNTQERTRNVTDAIRVMPLSKATLTQQSEGALVAVVAKR